VPNVIGQAFSPPTTFNSTWSGGAASILGIPCLPQGCKARKTHCANGAVGGPSRPCRSAKTIGRHPNCPAKIGRPVLPGGWPTPREPPKAVGRDTP